MSAATSIAATARAGSDCKSAMGIIALIVPDRLTAGAVVLWLAMSIPIGIIGSKLKLNGSRNGGANMTVPAGPVW